MTHQSHKTLHVTVVVLDIVLVILSCVAQNQSSHRPVVVYYTTLMQNIQCAAKERHIPESWGSHVCMMGGGAAPINTLITATR